MSLPVIKLMNSACAAVIAGLTFDAFRALPVVLTE